MRILLVAAAGPPPETLRDIVRSGSTELREAASLTGQERADRVVIWNGDHVVVDTRRLRWPDDEDEVRLLFQTAG